MRLKTDPLTHRSTRLVLEALINAPRDDNGLIGYTDDDLAILTGYGRRSCQTALSLMRDAGIISSDLHGEGGTRRTIQILRTL